MTTTTPAEGHRRIATIWWILAAALALRLVHLLTSLDSPLLWKIGPDEEFYRRFGEDVAFGRFGLSAEFAFMDPLYGYLLGAVFWLFGKSLFPVYLLQIAVDTATAGMLYRIGVALGRPQAGLIAAALHAVTATAFMFSLSLLKATWVAAFITGWMWLAVCLVTHPARWRWLAMGALLGLGVALRANLLLLVGASAVLLPALAWWRHRPGPSPVFIGTGLMFAALALPLALLAARNAEVSGAASLTPNNGGVVLHQIYNIENPRALSGAPSFVAYGHPSEIWRAYVAEAERRLGRELQPIEVNDYWKGQALDYLRAHPAQTARNMLRKVGEFVAWPEVPNNRSFEDERRFAPVLRWLPSPFGWLFALGVPGLLLLLRSDSRGWIPLAAISVGLATVAVFFAEDRFRFNVVTPFTLGAGVLLAQAAGAWHRRDLRWWGTAAVGVALLAALTLSLARNIPPTPLNWERVAWGYVHMGRLDLASRFIAQTALARPDAVGLDEFRGFIALQRGRPEQAIGYYDAALQQRVRHEVLHNRSLALEQVGNLEAALRSTVEALAISPEPDYRLRLGNLLAKLGRYEEAGAVYFALINDAQVQPELRPYALEAWSAMQEESAGAESSAAPPWLQ